MACFCDTIGPVRIQKIKAETFTQVNSETGILGLGGEGVIGPAGDRTQASKPLGQHTFS